MKDKAGRGRRGLLLFVLPILFALVTMGPTTAERLVEGTEPPTAAFFVEPDSALSPRQVENGDWGGLLESRFCLRAGETVGPEPGDMLLQFGNWQLLVRAEKQYLLDGENQRNTYRVLGQPLYTQVKALLA